MKKSQLVASMAVLAIGGLVAGVSANDLRNTGSLGTVFGNTNYAYLSIPQGMVDCVDTSAGAAGGVTLFAAGVAAAGGLPPSFLPCAGASTPVLGTINPEAGAGIYPSASTTDVGTYMLSKALPPYFAGIAGPPATPAFSYGLYGPTAMGVLRTICLPDGMTVSSVVDTGSYLGVSYTAARLTAYTSQARKLGCPTSLVSGL